MKKLFLLAVLLFTAMMAGAQGYTLKATLNGLPDGAELELVPMSHDSEKPIATATVKNGQFTITGQQDEPRLIMLRVKNSYGMGKFMLHNANIGVTANVSQQGYSQNRPVYHFAGMKVTGSTLSDEYFKMHEVRDRLDKTYEDNAKKYADIQQRAGITHTLASLVAGKKVALIDFWASWCRPCRMEIPNVKAQYAKYKDKGFQVISISIDRDHKAWQKACQEEKLQWPSFFDANRSLAALYHVKAIPAMYLFDVASGKILATDMDAQGEKLAELLAKLL